MRIVILGENISVHIQKWIKAIAADSSIELHLISFDRGVKFDEVTYHPLKRFTGTRADYLLNVFKVRAYIKKIKPDIIHAHYATSHGFLGALSGFHPFIVTGWGADIFDSPNNVLMKWMLKYTLKKADAISVLSKVTLREIKKFTEKNIHLIPFGVDVNKFLPAPGSSSGVLKIGTIRTLAEKYGVEYLIRAFALVSKKHGNVQLEIIGDGPLRLSFESLVSDLGIQEKVSFYGYVNQNSEFEKYISLLQGMSVFVIPSILDSETFGVAAVEASACGIPVVATAVGGLPEVVDNESTGLIVAPRNVEAIASALERLIADSDLRTRLGKNGRKKVEELYNWKNNTAQMINLYAAVLESKTGK